MPANAMSIAETSEPGIVIGLDGGGSHTHALCADTDGCILARAQGGASHPGKNPHAERDVQVVIATVLRRADRSTGDVLAIVAGLAGLNSTDDLVWAQPYLALPGLRREAYCVNDAVIAWAGAFCMQPGIVAIAGTGAIVLGVTKSGRHVRDYDFRHYGDLRARDLVAALVHLIVIGVAQRADAPLVAAVYAHFGVDSRSALASLASTSGAQPSDEFIREYGALAPAVTAAALNGAPLAQQVCDAAVKIMAVSVRLVGSQFATQPVHVALVGGVLESAYVAAKLAESLQVGVDRQFEVKQPRLSPEAGAALMALGRCGIQPSPNVIDRLAQG